MIFIKNVVKFRAKHHKRKVESVTKPNGDPRATSAKPGNANLLTGIKDIISKHENKMANKHKKVFSKK